MDISNVSSPVREDSESDSESSASCPAPTRFGAFVGCEYDDIYNDEPVEIPQSEMADPNQVPNNAGGFSFQVDDVMRLRRFLCLGSEGGTYYVQEKELTLDNAKHIIKMLENGDGIRVVDVIEEVSLSGRAAKQNPTLLALAICARYPTEVLDKPARAAVRRRAYEAFPKICRIPTHVFQFVEYCELIGKGKSTGWGRSHRNAVAGWYLNRDPKDLAIAVTKYKQRNGWSHRDLLRLSHPTPKIPAQIDHRDLFVYCVKDAPAVFELKRKEATEKGEEFDEKTLSESLRYVDAVERLSHDDDEVSAAALISEHNLVREHVPTKLLNSKLVWKALLERMPMTAMIRNLAKMTAVQLLAPKSDESRMIVSRLTNEDTLHKARIHPFNVLLAYYIYRSGRGDKGKLTWTPDSDIVAALNEAFYLSFKNVEPTGKRFLIGLDVSGSMGASIQGSAITCREASAALSMLFMRTEPLVEVMAFSETFIPLHFKKDAPLDDILNETNNMPFGGTDCALPMIWAKKYSKKFDVFVVITDNETWFGKIHPHEALRRYRAASGIWDARLIVIGMTSTQFTIADPNDPFMLDVAGFDAAAPEVIRNFILGLI